MRFRLLGTLAVESGGLDVAPVRPKQRALLALLLLRAGEAVATDELVDALWGERPPATAMTALYGHVAELRKRLGPERVVTQTPGYRLHLLEGDELDVARFRELTASAHGVTGPARASLLADALALFRGDPLSEFRYDEFAAVDAGRLEELRLVTLEDQLETEIELGRHVAAIPQLEALITEHPARERLRGQLMLALFRAGRQADALDEFRAARSYLVGELGVEPSRTLRELERRILNQDRELAAPGAPIGPAVATAIGSWLAARAELDRPTVRASLTQCGGTVVDEQAEVVVAAFARAREAVAGALALLHATAGHAAIGIHSTEQRQEGLRGAGTIVRAAREGHVLLSRATRDLLAESPLHDVDLRDAGRHPLDDLGAAWQLYYLATEDATASPPLRSLADSATNLQTQPGAFVGRAGEVHELRALLRQPTIRLVTLTGPAGVGKTRLAVQCAATLLDDFPDGVFVVDLAPVNDAALVSEAIEQSLGLSSGAVAEYLRARSVLLVLDNFEHLLPAAGGVAEAIAGTTSSALVTSRVALGAEDEHVVTVRPLPTQDATMLFATRARVVRPEFELTTENSSEVERICARLDGLPLAIELAASRVGVVSPGGLEERLDERLTLSSRAEDGVGRHRTLHAAIDWSYELRSPSCRRLFDTLAVFAGGFDLAALEAVAGDDVVDALATLVDASLVRVDGGDEPRFSLLETVRAYAADRLAETADADVLRDRHAHWFLELAERAEPHLREAPGLWVARLEPESDNLGRALDRLEGRTRLQLAATLWRFWYLTGRLSEGRRRLESALAHDASEVTPTRAKALLGLTVMAGNLGDYVASKAHAEETLAISRELGDEWTAAYATNLLARALHELGDSDAAERLLEASAAALRDLGDTHSALLASRNLAMMLERGDRQERARRQYEANLGAARDSNNPRIEASTLGALAALTAEEGRVADALPMLRRCLSLHRELGDRLDSALDLSRCAFVLTRSGDLETAARLLFVFERLEPEIGSRRAWVRERNAEVRAAIHDTLAPRAIEEARDEARAMTLDDALRRALEAI